jgi:3-oxoacyl-[acyl-carrier-protein] synthase II
MAIAITSWATVSAAGIGAETLAAACRDGATRPAEGAAAAFPGASVPDAQVASVPGLDVGEILGTRKGTRVFDRTTALAIAAAHLALQGVGAENHAATGLVLGSMCGSPQSLLDFMAATYEAKPPHLVSPEAFPRAVMNYAAGQCATWFGLKGPNATLAGANTVGLACLEYAARLVGRGTPRMLAGAVQEATPASLWLACHRSAGRGHAVAPQAEGAAMFLLEDVAADRIPGSRDGAILAACRTVTVPHADFEARVAGVVDCIARSLAAAALGPDAIDRVVVQACGIPAVDEVETAAVAEVFGRGPADCMQSGRILGGDSAAAAAALQVACLLGGWRDGLDGDAAHGCVVTVDHGGTVGCAILRRS